MPNFGTYSDMAIDSRVCPRCKKRKPCVRSEKRLRRWACVECRAAAANRSTLDTRAILGVTAAREDEGELRLELDAEAAARAREVRVAARGVMA